ncbi:lipopolysaccharide biosynthesis protein [Microbacterium lushaniae]|nr:lipopolysaccharide biosynthesis protein [Microbacterium lushaniae]KAA9159872.1 lipopolysaccharide biosynthesis protein [Microbacterium lushaniae]
MSETPTIGLAGAASSGAKVTMAGQFARLLIQLVGTVVLARLLSPADFGLVAMVMVIIGIAEVFRDFGLSLAALQAKQLSQGQRSNLFWINTAIGLLLSAAAFGSSWLIAALYGDPRLAAIGQVASVVFLLNGASAQYRVSLARELRFGRLTAIEVTSAACGLSVAIAVAAGGGGYWAIVLQPVSTALLGLIALVALVRWSPSWYDRGAPMRSLIRFGGYLTLATGITYASRNVDSFLVGLRYGATTLGLYDRAYQLVAYALGNLEGVATRVAQPVLSRLQEEPERFKRYLLAGQALLMQATLMAFGLTGSVVVALIPLVFGDEWAPMVPFLVAQLAAGAFASAARGTYWCFLASGRTKSQLQFTLLFRPIQIGMIVGSSFFGPYAIAVTYVLSNALLWLAGLGWVSRWGFVPVRSMMTTAVTAIVGYGAASVLGAVTTNTLLPIGYFGAAAVGALVFAAAVGVLYLLWPGFRSQIQSLRLLRRPRRGMADREGDISD